MARPRLRVLTWVIIAWIALTLIAAAGYIAQHQTCSPGGFDGLACHAQARAGFRAAIAWLVIGTIGLGTVWIVTQPRLRTRPAMPHDAAPPSPTVAPPDSPPAAPQSPPAE